MYAQIVADLLARRKSNIKGQRLNEEARPKSLDEAFAIQQAVAKTRSDSIAGWKCLLPLDVDKQIAAPIFSDTVETGAECYLYPQGGKARVEPEIAFVLGRDLPASETGYSEQEIDDAVASCHMALELMQHRFEDACEATFFEKLADCMVNQGLFIGPEIDKAAAYKATSIDVSFTQNGNTQSFDGVHPNELPFKPLHWLINTMTKKGVAFKAGQAMITGSYAGIVDADFNERCTIKYTGLGEYTVTFKSR